VLYCIVLYCTVFSNTVLGALFKTAQIKYLVCHVFLSVRLSVRVRELGSHWTDFHEIWYLNTFPKTVDKIQDALTLFTPNEIPSAIFWHY
jgi:hypothetical protein